FTTFDSEVAALKSLVKTLISELKDAKNNNGDRKVGIGNGETKKK
ncbi:14959_t:CDS:1, partial [Entrophospora sp. SA101]